MFTLAYENTNGKHTEEKFKTRDEVLARFAEVKKQIGSFNYIEAFEPEVNGYRHPIA